MSKKTGAYIIKLTLLAVLSYFVLSICLSKYALQVTEYEVSSDMINDSIRAVQISDIHSVSFGKDNTILVNKIANCNPDLILVSGDLINQHTEDIETELNLLKDLCNIAPVYMSLGNHEFGYAKNYNAAVLDKLSETGASVLDGEFLDITVKSQTIRIGGIYGYCLPESSEVQRPAETAFLKEFTETENYKILLCHMPLAWYRSGSLNSWDVDCVFSGHTHGGQIRIPFVGGLWAPDMGWFPGKEAGLYYSDDGEHVMVLSRGLGNTEKIPRFNNIPEIVVVDIVPA